MDLRTKNKTIGEKRNPKKENLPTRATIACKTKYITNRKYTMSWVDGGALSSYILFFCAIQPVDIVYTIF